MICLYILKIYKINHPGYSINALACAYLTVVIAEFIFEYVYCISLHYLSCKLIALHREPNSKEILDKFKHLYTSGLYALLHTEVK